MPTSTKSTKQYARAIDESGEPERASGRAVTTVVVSNHAFGASFSVFFPLCFFFLSFLCAVPAGVRARARPCSAVRADGSFPFSCLCFVVVEYVVVLLRLVQVVVERLHKQQAG